jgi:hypothetical protein
VVRPPEVVVRICASCGRRKVRVPYEPTPGPVRCEGCLDDLSARLDRMANMLVPLLTFSWSVSGTLPSIEYPTEVRT